MSLIDPNQIISLAPSQNVGQPTVPFAPGSATAAVYDRDLDQDVAGSIMQAGTYDPTAAAKAIRLSQETRIPFPLAQNNYDDLAHRQKITAWQQTVSQNPTLAPLLRDPEFAAVAQDDSQNVGWWNRFKSSIADLNKAREDWWFETTKDIATGGMIGFRVAQRGQVGARMMDSEITPEDRETIRKADADLKAFQRPASFLGSAAELIGQQVVTVPEALREAAVGATAGGLAGAIGGPLAPATMAGGMALGATAGLATGFARQAYRVEAGNAYVDMIDKGVEPDTAYPVAMGIGLVNASLELGGASFVAKPFQQAFRLAAKNAINEAIIQPTTRQALRAAGASYVKAIGAETSTEVMQEVVTMVGEEAAMLASGIDSELTAADAAKRVVDTAIHTAMGMAVLGVPGAGVTLYSGMRTSARTQREQNALTQIAQNAKDTKFRADAPTVYERLAASQLNGTSAETTYIDAERVKEVLDQAGLTPAEIDQVLPGVRQQLPDALASRGDVTIPTAKWAANTVGTKIEAALLPHMRLSATSMSPVEAAAFQAEREQLVAEASQILEQKQAVDAEWTRQAKDIADTIRQQAVAVRGMTETDADVFASGVQAFYVTKAVEMGMTPEQLFRLAPYTIQGEAAGVPLEQAATMDADYMAAVERGDMETAQRMVDEAAKAAGYWRRDNYQRKWAFKKVGITPREIESEGIPLDRQTERSYESWNTANTTVFDGLSETMIQDDGNIKVFQSRGRGLIWTRYQSITNGKPSGFLITSSPVDVAKSIEKNGIGNQNNIFAKYVPPEFRNRGISTVLVEFALNDLGTLNADFLRTPDAQRSYSNYLERGFIKSADAITRDEAGNIVPLSRRFDITSPRIFEQAAVQPRLMAVHNLSADNLVFADRMGGLAVPSIGVITEERGGVEGFGEITLLGTREMADPYLSRVFESDAYSARFPRAEWPKVAYAKADKFVDQLREVAARFEDRRIIGETFDAMVNNPDAEKVVGYWLRSMPVGALFLKEKGIDIAPVMRERKTLSGLSWDDIDNLRPAYEAVDQQVPYEEMEASPEYRALREQYASAVRSKYESVREDLGDVTVEQLATDFTPTTLQRLSRDMNQTERQTVDDTETRAAIELAMEPFIAEFKSWVDAKVRGQFGEPFIRIGRSRKPYTLGNIVDVMTSPKVRGEEKGMTFGAGAARAETAVEFVDLEEMREAAKSAIVDPDEYSKAAKKTEAQLAAFRDAVIEYTTLTDWRGKSDTWAALDGSMRALANYGKRKRKDAKTMRAALAKEGFAVANMPPAIITQAIEAAEALFTAPVPYFEAKPQRAVRLGEFGGAVIPSDAGQEVRDVLERNGISYMTYLAGNEEDRQRAVRQMARSPEARGDVLFQAPVTPGFYSALEREVNAIDAKALPASGWSERFKGLISKGAIKADELEWSGLADYLKMQEGKVSKDTVLEFLRGNGVRVERVTLQDVRRITREGPLFYVEGPLDVVGRDAPGWFVRDADGSIEEGPFDSEAEAEQVSQQFEAEASSKELAARPLPTKHAQYTLPGGKNYREVLLTLPFREPATPTGYTVTETQYDDGTTAYFAVTPTTRSRAYNTRAEAETELQRTASGLREWRAEQAAFKSTHWDQPNVLVHLRLNDRVDAEGKRVLFVEEVQSDWGQAGKKKGFLNTALREQRIAELERIKDEAIKDAEPYTSVGQDAPAEILDRWNAAANELNRIRRKTDLVPRAPFVETTDGWLSLGLKQVLLEAVRGNYDRVAFVTGQQSADRYDLSNQVDSIVYRKTEDGKYDIEAIKDSSVLLTKKAQSPSDLEDVLGKDVAKRIIDGVGEQPSDYPAEYKELAGVNLKVGGEGMKSFYDKIVPIAMGKLLKKYGGGKIGQIAITESNAEVGRQVGGGWNVYVDGLLDADRPTFRTEAEALASISLQQPGFDITPELVAKLESGLPLFQAAAASGPRGGFDPRTLTTFINKGGDLSTWIHETAHFHFTVLGRLASRADAPESIRADMDTLLQWGKVDGATPEERLATWNAMTVDQQRKLHEQFAYSWEVYQFEGKAPSVEMQGVFERFRMWLMRVYKSVLEINAVYRSQFGEDLPALTPEVRQVMDRMLATQEQIERQQAINQMIPSFQSQDESGMSDAEWAAYQKMQAEATEAAVTDLGKASLSQMEWLSGARSRLLKQMQTRNARARREMRDEVSRQVRSDPTYRALRYIRTGKIEGPDGAEIVVDGPHKLSTAGVKEIIDALPMDRLIDLNMLPEGVMAENGRDPDLVAADFGFDSGDALLRAMVGMRSLEDEINARTDARLLAENALMSPEQMEEEVQRAIHNEARARFVAVEQRWLERLDRPARIILEAAKQAAKAKVAGTLVRDLRPQQWIAAESRAARDARLAYSNRRTPEEIGRSVYTRVYNEQEAAGTGLVEAQVIAEAARVKAVVDAQARLDAFRAAYPEADPAAIAIRAKRAQTYNNQMAAQTLEAKAEIEKAVVYLRRVLRAENRKKMGADYADQIEGILERFDLAAISTEKARARQALAEWLEGERKKGLDPELPPVIADEAERKPYKNMTVAEFRELADAVRTLEYIGKNTTKILLAGKRLEFEATRDRIVENGEENAERRGRKAKPPVSVPTKLQRRIEAIRGYHAAQLTPSAIIQIIDGGEDGPLSRYLLEPFAEQANFQTEQRVRATEFLDKTLRPIIKSPRNRPIVIDSIGRSMQLEERLVVALNYGNDGNARRLLVGEDWTEAQVADILATLTKAELEAVQKIWDFFETFRPMISAKERRLTGKDLEYVDRRELTVPRTADGQSVALPGGYYPIRYDPRRSTMVQAIDEVEEAKRMMDGARTASTTSDTFKKKRSQNGLGKPLTLTMNALYSGVNEVIDDLSWQEWLIAANRLMRDGKFAKMVRERYGDAYYQQLREWISTVAVGDRVASSVVENMAVAVRQNVSVSAMAWRAVTAGIQITGIFPAAAKIGTINTLRGLTYLMTSPRQASERAREKSKFMANRGRTRYRDLNEIRNLVRGETGIRRNYMATAYAAIGAMQSISDNTTWWGRYEAAKRDGRDENTAVFLADQAVKDTQGSGLTGDLSSVMRGGKAQSPYVKLFTSFMQYSNTMYSLTSERAMTANGRGDLAARLFLILIPGAILEELIRNLLTAKAEEDEPEELVRRLAANQLDYLISLPFGIRELTGIGDVLLGVEPRYQYRGPSGLRAISATGQLVNELSQGEFDAGLRRSLINFVGITTGAPSTQINATIDGINAVMEGEAEGADAILAPITGFKTR